MTFIPSFNPLYPVLPLAVQAYGRVWELSPWFEPVWWRDGRLAALDMLSRPVDRKSGATVLPAWFFTRLPQQELQRVMCWQSGIVNRMLPWCISREVLVSICMTLPLAMSVLSAPSVQDELQAFSPYIRLKISERDLPPEKGEGSAPFLQGLLALAPLWLDNFGADSRGLSWLMSGLFDAVKIDRHLLNELHVHPGGARYLAALGALTGEGRTQIIAGGVSDPELLAFARRGQVAACQGALWPAVPAEHLHMLADRCPGAQCSIFPAGGEHDA